MRKVSPILRLNGWLRFHVLKLRFAARGRLVRVRALDPLGAEGWRTLPLLALFPFICETTTPPDSFERSR